MLNVLEESVHEVFARLRRMEAGYCHCLKCQDDVIAHALNHARPRYISGSGIGSAVTRVSLTRDQAQAEVAVLVLGGDAPGATQSTAWSRGLHRAEGAVR